MLMLMLLRVNLKLNTLTLTCSSFSAIGHLRFFLLPLSMCMSSSWLVTPGEACSSSMLNDCGCPPDEAEVFRVSYLLLLFVVPDVPLGGVEGI